ncbi:CPBP family intramembrane metalloprotease [Xanthomonas campestris pv. phormiicola]|nr:CPBP family intramembrane metalloprotease [Xanthomonas campestris pv. phormiicola]UYC18337.1 CPBP family intramembrane metalloprotease [Xanthomonas campestris pv. phormiicola]
MLELTKNSITTRLRLILALAFIVAAYFFLGPLGGAVYAPIEAGFDLRLIQDNELVLAPYVLLMLIRFFLNLLVAVCVCVILGQRLRQSPLAWAGAPRMILIGAVTGTTVMAVAILLISASGAASITYAEQSAQAALMHGMGWWIAEFIGASSEEFFGRVAILLVAERFVGWRGAAIASGIIFSVMHLDNPGASEIWLLRLFIQGVLLAYAVYRTGSIWWSAGYHAGWNWASAPLFGAAGSGYFVKGHTFEYLPIGSEFVTGGPVGPEGSIFAFLAVLSAFFLLHVTTRNSMRYTRAWPKGGASP